MDERHLTTLMVTHNMNDAIPPGQPPIMMHEGRIIYDVSGAEKRSLTVQDLLQKFEEGLGRRARQRPYALELNWDAPARAGRLSSGPGSKPRER